MTARISLFGAPNGSARVQGGLVGRPRRGCVGMTTKEGDKRMSRRTFAGGRKVGSAGIRMRTFATALAAACTLVVLGTAAPAMATSIQHEFDVFAHCPLANPAVNACVYSTTTAGEFKIGNSTVPINKTIVLQGGLTEGSPFLVDAEGAETLSRTPLEVPGGLLGIELLGNLTEVTATSELAGPVEINVPAFGLREGAAVVLPMKVKLDNPALGPSCYVGSDSEPITPHLTTGTTKPPSGTEPITGSTGTLEIVGAGKLDIFANNSLVDNTFPVPGVNGCAGILAPVVDASVDLKEGLPAAAGTNVAKLTGTLSQASATAVIRQREIPEFGRCVKVVGEKVEKTTVYHGLYVNSGCTYESGFKLGKYEWLHGPGPASKFSGSGKVASLETVGGSKISCLESTNSGEYTGLKTATIGITFTGCARAGNKEPCQSSGATSGEVKAPGLQGTLGFVRDTAIEGVTNVVVGLSFTHEPSLISAECGAAHEALVVTGSVIAPLATIDKPSLANTLKLKASGGKQIPESFEEEAKETLSETLGSTGPEQTGLTTVEKIANQEKIEIKALAE
jgi:hypothetical protein